MESVSGKLFIGGISWDTNEDRLREYFGTFGEVLEAMIMKDRTTGRARGFGFVIFSDPAVAEKVVSQKHVIDGRWVEAKKAVPYDQQSLSKNTSTIPDSPGPCRTKKIFVGGLPSTITEADFKKYFEQFGTIADVVVMYDHNTQRHRGFGFITYASDDSVDKALIKTFHELNGKMVEVKRAVPKEQSPGPAVRSPIGGYNIGLSRSNSFLEDYTNGYNPNLIGSYGMRLDGRFGQLGSGQNSLPPFSPSYGIGVNFDPGMSPSYGGISNFSNHLGYGRVMNPIFRGNSSRYTISSGNGESNDGSWSVFGSTARNLLGNSSLNYTTNSSSPKSYMTPGSGTIGEFGNGSLKWGGSSPPISAHGIGSGSIYANDFLNYGPGESTSSLGVNNFARSTQNASTNAFLTPSSNALTNLCDDSSVFEDPTWRSASPNLNGSGPFVYDATSKDSAGYMGGYNDTNRQTTRAIAT